MPMGWRVKDGQRVRVVREDILFEWMRARLQSNPAHQYRMRKLLAEARIEDASEMQQHPGGGPSHPLGKERT